MYRIIFVFFALIFSASVNANENALTAVSPLDGRYAEKTFASRDIFSELNLMKLRVYVEVEWFKALSAAYEIPELPVLSDDALTYINSIVTGFTLEDGKTIKSIENETKHDVKAVEYYLQEKFSQHPELAKRISFIHFGCTSEDINNIAYALIVLHAREQQMVPKLQQISRELKNLATKYSKVSMLSRTHGQPASPTTLGKEIIIFHHRLERQISRLAKLEILAKFNGAVGNYNAALAAYPSVDWITINKNFIEKLGLKFNQYTTQIEPHDFLAEYFQAVVSCNNILLDMSRDIWNYVSIGYFIQKVKNQEIGSSTMPHKVNPIDFENAEGNLGVANALLDHLANKLPISRWQRDLTDSTALRNVGVALTHSLLSYQSILSGLKKLEVNNVAIKSDLDKQWILLAEPIQTVMRKHGCTNAYEQLKDLTRGQSVGQGQIQDFIRKLNIPYEDKQRLLGLTPENYIGLAANLCE